MLKLNHGGKKLGYVHKPITPELVVDVRYLHVLLLQVERVRSGFTFAHMQAWAYFMQLKHVCA